MRVFAILAFTVSTLAISPAMAKDDKPADPNKKSCRRVETTGSILGGKLTCHTKAEWLQIDAANDMNTRHLREPLSGGMGGVSRP
jgi:hypothetical protein